MKSLTSWKVYRYTTNTGETKTVVVGLDTDIGKGVVEEVETSDVGQINRYKLFGKHNHYFEGADQFWLDYKTQHNVNSVTDISAEYE